MISILYIFIQKLIFIIIMNKNLKYITFVYLFTMKIIIANKDVCLAEVQEITKLINKDEFNKFEWKNDLQYFE